MNTTSDTRTSLLLHPEEISLSFTPLDDPISTGETFDSLTRVDDDFIRVISDTR